MKKNKESVAGEDGLPTVVLRRRDSQAMPPPTKAAPSLSSPYSFMRRSCTFVAESSLGLRKSAARTTSVGQPLGVRTSLKGPPPVTATPWAPQKVVKDRKNLALQVRQKKDMLEETANGDSRLEEGVGGGGRMSKLVGGLRAWSSTEDVRQSFMGALGRTVSVIKQKPVSRKVKQAFTPTSRPLSTIPDTTKTAPTKPNNNIKNSTSTTRAQPKKTKPGKPSDQKTEKQTPSKTPPGKFQFGKTGGGKTKTVTPNATPTSTPTSTPAPANIRWFRHIQEAQEAYTARDGRNRRPHPHTPLQDLDDPTPPPPDPLRDVDDGGEVDGGDVTDSTSEGLAETKVQQGATKSSEQAGRAEDTTTTAQPTQPPASPETLTKKTELLRRKDLKIRQALEEKQQIIANILNIPYEDFESVVDMAGEPAVGNKEPKELVLAAMFQAKCLQESLNEALNLTEGDIVAARANEGAGRTASLPLYQAPMTKLMTISTTLSQQLSSLLNLVSERDDERERMRKELVASRERLHQLHMRQNSASAAPVSTQPPTPPAPAATQPTASSPYTSRPSSFVSVTSSVADHSDTSLQHDTDEDGAETSKGQETTPDTTREEVPPETYEDATSGSEATEIKSGESEASGGVQEDEEARGCDEVSAT